MAKQLLVVEDDESEGLYYKLALEREGYVVDVVDSADAAVAYVREHPPDAVILDINMPEKDGIEALGEMMAINPKLPVIINTAYSAYKDNFMTWSAVAYVVKSSDLTELKEVVGKVVRGESLEGRYGA
ncbi:MAG TPA: response regulator [Armatimonadetes bacterium]|nr:response regulator [Armatimonadota bacterium]